VISRTFSALVLFLSLAAVGSAQTISGTVSDTTGAVLPSATVEASLGERPVGIATTDANGRYQLTLEGGSYHLTVRLGGFTQGTADVDVSAAATQDFQLGLAPLNDTVVVTASRTAQSQQSVTESLSVFSKDDIERLGAASLADIVRFTPGLSIETTGREGEFSSLFSRGGESDYNQVLIDGVQVNTSGGSFDFSRVSAAEVERVEVVRGAQSALYGSDAIGSVIQIFTKRGTPTGAPAVQGSIEGGSFNSARGDARVLGGARNRLNYQFGSAFRRTDGAFEDQLPENDEFRQGSVDGGLGVIVGNQTRLRVGGRYSDAEGRSVGQIGFTPGDTGTGYDTNDYSYYLTMDQTLRNWFTHSAGITYFRNDWVSVDKTGDSFPSVYAVLSGTPGALFPDSPRLVRLLDQATFTSLAANTFDLGVGEFLAATPFGVFDFPFLFESEHRRYSAQYQANVTWAGDQVLSAGYEFEREEDPLRENATLGGGFEIENNAFFVQQRLALAGQWYATVGVRMDDNSRFGTEASPKLSAGGYPVPINEGAFSSVKLFGNVGSGIKNPTFSELFGSDFVNGNPDLRPERATTIDAGVELTFNAQQWLGRVTYFDNDYEDQVAFQFSQGFGGDGIPDYLNIAGSQARGVEIEGGLQRPIGGLTVTGSYAYTDTEVVATVNTSQQFRAGQPLLRRPKHSGNAQATFTQGDASLHLNVRFVGDRHDSSFLGLSRVSDGTPVDITVNPGYTLVGAGGQYRVSPEFTAFARIENLTDEKYFSALGYPGMPRAFVVGGRFTLSR
jgi:vitamin B12 transporter